MRSSKSRSRSKSNRPRTLGNITNRVFDSSGPEGKVRGTPQQIVDKYQALSRDAQLSNDRVAAENFLQHAEHYTRLLAEATREQVAEQEARRLQEQQFQAQQRERNERNDRGDSLQPDQREDNRGDNRSDTRPDYRSENRNDVRNDAPRNDDRRPDRDLTAQPATGGVIEPVASEDDSNLVETPETKRPTRSRQPRHKHVQSDVQPNVVIPAEGADAVQTADERPKRASAPRRPRAPRKPKLDDSSKAAE